MTAWIAGTSLDKPGHDAGGIVWKSAPNTALPVGSMSA